MFTGIVRAAVSWAVGGLARPAAGAAGRGVGFSAFPDCAGAR
jgi:hypothetical protein